MALRLRIGFAWVWLAAIMAGIPANPQDLASVLVGRFESAYRHSNTLQATFLEKYVENGKEVRAEAGVAYFGKPGKMRWEYESPEHNLFVIDGKWSWFYVPADHTVTRIRAKQSTDWRTPLALLAGEMKVSRICAQVRLDPTARAMKPGGVVLKCRLRADQPKSEADRNGADLVPSAASPSTETVSFEVNAQNGELIRIDATVPGGIQIEFSFTNWRFNPALEHSKFQFIPPKGVAIVDGELAAGKSP